MVGVKVYGRRPRVLRVMRKTIREVNSTAHLWPPVFRGRRSCWVNRLINQPCRLDRRLFSQRGDGEGNKTQGRVRAIAIKGIPISVGLANWSKKLSVMVSFRALFWEYLYSGGKVH